MLRELNSAGSALPIITMTSHGSIETAAEVMHLNAFDYITKPFGTKEILEIIQRAAEFSRSDSGSASHDTTGRTVPVMGQSTVMIEIYKEIGRIAPGDGSVLITGERGSGHEVVAKAIHDHSPRMSHAFITVSCSQQAETQLNRELFQPGGAFQKASFGTLYLEDVHVLTLPLQTQLWRLLQIRSALPSDAREQNGAEVRLISATNQSPDALLASGFRKDLLSRIGAHRVHLPALRERAADIPLLAAHFVRKYAKRLKKSVVLTSETADWLKTLPWPGNIRELENAVERAVGLNTSGEILPEDFGQSISPPPDLISILQKLRKYLPETAEAQRLMDAALELARKERRS
jgi:DNA-binding NtrC family response regulator